MQRERYGAEPGTPQPVINHLDERDYRQEYYYDTRKNAQPIPRSEHTRASRPAPRHPPLRQPPFFTVEDVTGDFRPPEGYSVVRKTDCEFGRIIFHVIKGAAPRESTWPFHTVESVNEFLATLAK